MSRNSVAGNVWIPGKATCEWTYSSTVTHKTHGWQFNAIIFYLTSTFCLQRRTKILDDKFSSLSSQDQALGATVHRSVPTTGIFLSNSVLKSHSPTTRLHGPTARQNITLDHTRPHRSSPRSTLIWTTIPTSTCLTKPTTRVLIWCFKN